MNSESLPYRGWLYWLAFLIALGLRLAHLGALPLSDTEATSALQALHITQGLKSALGPQPAYILLTAPLFFLYGGGTNFLARFIPALVGSAFVFAPLLFQGRIKERAALILAFFLAIDPGLVALSRYASGSILAVVFLLLAWGYWNQEKTIPSGFFLGLALLSGPTIWMGLLGFSIVWALGHFIEPKQKLEEQEDKPSTSSVSAPSSLNKSLIFSALTTFVLVGTLFFLVPNGLGAALASIPTYLRGWTQPSGIPSTWLLLSLVVYQPLALFLGLLGLIRGWWQGRRRAIRLSIWILVALLLAIFYPAHQVTDLIWAIVPLLVLASMELARHFVIFPEEQLEVRGVTLLTIFIFIFAWLDLASLSWTATSSEQANLRVWLFIGALVLLVLSVLLVAAGWSIRTAKLGGVWGLTVCLSVLTLAAAVGAAGLRGLSNPEFWPPDARPAQADLLLGTINDLSELGLRNDKTMSVVMSGIDSPALEWVLRDHNLEVTNNIDVSTSPAFVITPSQNDFGLAASYRGQDFAWNQTTSWDAALINDWARWYTLRQMPATSEMIILWARTDLFLDSSSPVAP